MTLIALVAMVFLLLLNGFFVAAEFAFTAASRHTLEVRPGRSAQAAVRLIDDLSFSLAGAQLGITITSLLLGFVAEPAVATLLEAAISSFVEISDSVLHSISFVVALGIVVFLHMVIGEMAPKNVAIADPERSSLLMALPFRVYTVVFGPVIAFLNGTANLILRLVGIDPNERRAAHTADELASLITAGRREGVVEEFAHRLLTGAIDLWELDAYHVMVPRTDIVALPDTATPNEIEEVVTEHGFSRVPIYGSDLDDVRGFVHAKDLLTLSDAEFEQPIPVRLIRPLLVVPESAGVDTLLEDMRRQRNHLALVVDEHGGTAGIITMEDIVEEVVGEIRDEHDSEAEGVRKISAGRYIIDASLRPAKVRKETGIDLPDGDYDTVSGLVMDRLERVPRVGDLLSETGWSMRVRRMDGRRVGEVDVIAKRSRRHPDA